MSYQVLARKWRPRGFDRVVGQGHGLRALVNALDSDRLHHAYLFTGTRGVGKTSLARVFAKALNCEKGVSSTPCGECWSGVEVDEGRFVDLIEVDAASRTKVDETRDLLDNVQYAPTRGRFKVYLIDEVHMFSKSSFNALLKTLEEPPEHVKFLLATTDPQKIPVTILSRCLQFNLRQMPADVIEKQLVKITREEGLETEPEALQLLARSASGSMRDGLSLLDQAIAFSGSSLTLAETASMLGAVDHGQVVEMLMALHRGDANGLLSQVDQVAARVPDYSAILEELLSMLHALSVRQQVEDAPVQVEVPTEQLAQMAAMIPAEELQLYYQLGLHGRRDLPLAPTPRIGLEMALLRMLAFQPERGPVTAEFKATDGEAPAVPAMPGGAVPAEQVTPSTPVSGAADTPIVPEPPSSDSVPTSPEPPQQSSTSALPDDQQPAYSTAPVDSAPVFESESPAAFVEDRVEETMPEIREVPPSVSQPPVATGYEHSIPGDSEAGRAAGLPNWSQLAYALSLTGLAQQLAAQLALVEVTDHEYRFTLDATHRAVLSRSAQSRLEQALQNYLGRSVNVNIDVVRNVGETPAKERQRIEQQRLDEATRKLQEDPTVKALAGAFGAQLEPDSIEPLSPE